MDNNYNNNNYDNNSNNFNDNNFNGNNFNNNNFNDNNFNQQQKGPYQNPYTPNNNGMKEPSEGTTSMVLGILSIVLCCSFPISPALAIISIIYANKCRSLMGGFDTSNSKVGRTCGIIGLVLSIIVLVCYIVYYVLCALAIFSEF